MLLKYGFLENAVEVYNIIIVIINYLWEIIRPSAPLQLQDH